MALYQFMTSLTPKCSMKKMPSGRFAPKSSSRKYIADQYVADGKTSVDWCFSTMPSEEWKNGVGSALTAYAAGTGKWDDVVTAFVDGWAKEYKLANG